jgi:hypothetical protein
LFTDNLALGLSINFSESSFPHCKMETVLKMICVHKKRRAKLLVYNLQNASSILLLSP